MLTWTRDSQFSRTPCQACTEKNAGNFENAIFLRPDDLTSAALMRKTIRPKEPPLFQRHVTQTEPMPDFWAMVGESTAIATNWFSFVKPALIDGCDEDVQIPLHDFTGAFPSSSVTLIIFRAGSLELAGLAVMIAGPAKELADLEKEVPFLCKEHLLWARRSWQASPHERPCNLLLILCDVLDKRR